MVYESPTGRPDVQKDIDRLTVEGVERFAAAARWLSVTPTPGWHEPNAKKLKGYQKLYEMKFIADRVQQRPLGFFGPTPGVFSIVLWATHKQDVYKPSSALVTANKRIKDVCEGRAKVAPLKLDGEDFP